MILQGFTPTGPPLSADEEALLIEKRRVLDAKAPPLAPLLALTIPQNSFT